MTENSERMKRQAAALNAERHRAIYFHYAFVLQEFLRGPLSAAEFENNLIAVCGLTAEEASLEVQERCLERIELHRIDRIHRAFLLTRAKVQD